MGDGPLTDEELSKAVEMFKRVMAQWGSETAGLDVPLGRLAGLYLQLARRSGGSFMNSEELLAAGITLGFTLRGMVEREEIAL